MGISFYSGKKYSEGKLPDTNANAVLTASTASQGRTGLGGQRRDIVSGKILNRDATSIIIELGQNPFGNGQNNKESGSKIVFYTDKTTVMKTVAGNLSDLFPGQQISVMGTPNPDGTVNATSVQIRQPFRAMPNK